MYTSLHFASCMGKLQEHITQDKKKCHRHCKTRNTPSRLSQINSVLLHLTCLTSSFHTMLVKLCIIFDACPFRHVIMSDTIWWCNVFSTLVQIPIFGEKLHVRSKVTSLHILATPDCLPNLRNEYHFDLPEYPGFYVYMLRTLWNIAPHAKKA